jgi:TRAP-type transport system small permease protein
MKKLTRVMDVIEHWVNMFLIGILGVMTVLLFASVSSRHFLRISFPGVDPIARFGQVWIMLLGSVVVLRKGMHIGIDNFLNMIPEPYRQWVLKFNMVLILGFAVAMFSQGFRLIEIAGTQIVPELGIRFAYVYYMIPVAAGFLILTCIELLLRPKLESLTEAE